MHETVATYLASLKCMHEIMLCPTITLSLAMPLSTTKQSHLQDFEIFKISRFHTSFQDNTKDFKIIANKQNHLQDF